MLSLIPLIVIGGVAMKFTDEYIRKPFQRKRKPFDKQEERDLKPRRKVLGFGDFSNIGW